MRQSTQIVSGLLCFAFITNAIPVPQDAGQPLFSVVSHNTKTADTSTATATATANSSHGAEGINEPPYRTVGSDVYAKGPANAPPVSISYDGQNVTVVFQAHHDHKKNETNNGGHIGHDHGKNQTSSGEFQAGRHCTKNGTTRGAQKTASAPAAATSGSRTVSYIGVDGKKYESQIYSRSLKYGTRYDGEAEPSYSDPPNTPAKHPSTASAVPEDREIKELGKSKATPLYLNPLNTPAKNVRVPIAEPEDREIKDLGKPHGAPSYLNPLNTPAKQSSSAKFLEAIYGQAKRRSSKCVVVAGGVVCKKAASDEREDLHDQAVPSYMNDFNTPPKRTAELSMVEKRSSEAGKCKWYHLGPLDPETAPVP